MEFREIGKTKKQAGIIGLGCEHLDGKPYEQVKETIDTALANGVNIFDIFMPGREVRENIARALGDRRKQVMIQGHFGSTDIQRQYDISRDMPTVQRYFEELLRLFGGYIDFGMLFFIDSEKDYQDVFETEFIDYALRQKEKGYVGHLGFSSHNPEIAAKVIETGLVEMMMFSVNPAFDMLPAQEYALTKLDTGFDSASLVGFEPKRAALYKLCSQKQIGITVMKTLGGGKLIAKEHTPFSQPLTVPQCVHYALSRPAVSSVLLGCKTGQEVLDALGYLDLDDSQRDYAEVLGRMRNDFKGNCVYCNHCQPCPSDIDIATVNKYLDIARLTPGSVPPSIQSHYNHLSAKGSDCIGCGSCESRCPFAVPIIDNMREAAEMFTCE